MEKEFVPYEQVSSLIALGFNEPVIAHRQNGLDICLLKEPKVLLTDLSMILYQQAFRWFREKFNIYAIILPSYADDKVVKDRFFYEIANGRKLNQELNYHNTYEEAELACLDKLIKIVEQKNEK